MIDAVNEVRGVDGRGRRGGEIGEGHGINGRTSSFRGSARWWRGGLRGAGTSGSG
jgi:hypothetical protein